MDKKEDRDVKGGEGEFGDHEKEVVEGLRPRLSTRKSSFSQAFTNLTSKPFTRRRTATTDSGRGLPDARADSSHITCPSGTPGSLSESRNLGALASKPSSTDASNEILDAAAPTKRPRRISERLAQTQFFSNQYQRFSGTPISTKHKRESSVQIEQRGLMAPIQPPMPRSSTMGALNQGQQAYNSPKTPGFMRPTSSSTARRSSLNTPTQRNTPPAAFMPTRSGKKTSSGGRTSSYGLQSSVKTPKTPTSQHSRPWARLTSTKASAASPDASKPSLEYPRSKGSTPFAAATLASSEASAINPGNEDSGIFPPNNSPATEHSISPYPPRRYDSPFEHPVIPRSTLIPAPIYSRTAFRHEIARNQGLPVSQSMPTFRDRQVLAASNVSSSFVIDSSSELRVPQIQESDPIEEGERAADITQDIPEDDSPTETIVPASKGKATASNPSIKVNSNDEEQGEEMNIGDLTSTIEDNNDDANATEDLPFGPLEIGNPRLITTPLPLPTWLGRYTSLSDRFLTSSLLTSPSTSPMHDATKRQQRIFIHLHSLCTTEEARASLAEFRTIMEDMGRGKKGREKEKEKGGFLGGLMGRRK